MSNPLVTVLIPVYNAGEYLKESIESILAQTYEDFELIIINDGSTDSSQQVIDLFNDHRIISKTNPSNIGLVGTLNKGIDLAKGKYIVRMDQDDISTPDRLVEQVQFMESNPEIGLAGTLLETIGNRNEKVNFLCSDEEIRFRLLFSTYIRHPSVIIRKKVLDDYHLKYRPEFPHVEDHDLWVRMAEHCQLAIMPKVLLKYRVHDNNTVATEQKTQSIVETKIRKRQLEQMGINISDSEMDLFNKFVCTIKLETNQYLRGSVERTQGNIESLGSLLKKIIDGNNKVQNVSPKILNTTFASKYWDQVAISSHLGLFAIKHYIKKGFLKYHNPGMIVLLRVFVKSLVKKEYI